ncbi:hypothetical protein CIB84_006889 [Bambusicola thoracicus]|uniref:Uncharacterized protein n=1 Tax=Bambusicola thoracicus TaxID=9083 RepID=A0A2P4SZ31_BAMTH|nr:hypothetical protein CIB84_006889 [Bambusicola thoracicus]
MPVTTYADRRWTLLAVFVATFLFSLTWQFNQFMMLIQALALFILDCFDILPTAKVRSCIKISFLQVTWLYIIQISGLLLVCALQFFNSMILGSLLISFNASVLIARTIQKNLKKGSVLSRLGKLILHALLVSSLTLLVNKFIKKILNLESDEHIFKFLKAKFGFGATRYDLAAILLFVTQVIKYLIPIITLLYILYKHPEFFSILSSVCFFYLQFWPGIMDELLELREFYDPDTVELMNWIK